MIRNSVKATVPLAAAAAGTYLAVRRPWLRTGASREEVRRPLPGDELVSDATLQATRATTVHAPAERIWPWLVQMGHGRAGWYSYDEWDNGGEASADRIVPELQSLRVGQVIRDATGPFGFVVARLDPGRALVFRCTIHPVTGRVVKPSEADPGSRGYARAFLDFSWAFVLDPIDDRSTRLLVRVRYRHQRRPWVRAMVHGYELVDALFSRRMLAGIRLRAERPVVAEATAA